MKRGWVPKESNEKEFTSPESGITNNLPTRLLLGSGHWIINSSRQGITMVDEYSVGPKNFVYCRQPSIYECCAYYFFSHRSVVYIFINILFTKANRSSTRQNMQHKTCNTKLVFQFVKVAFSYIRHHRGRTRRLLPWATDFETSDFIQAKRDHVTETNLNFCARPFSFFLRHGFWRLEEFLPLRSVRASGRWRL